MIPIKMRLEDEEGKALVEHYNVKGFPSIVFVDKDSIEIDRIIGYLPPAEFLEEITRIQSGKGTILDLIEKTNQTPKNFNLWLELAGKYEDRGDLVAARDVYMTVANAGVGDKDFVFYKLVELNSYIDNDILELEKFISSNRLSDYTPYAFESIITIMRKNNNIKGEADAWLRYINLLKDLKTYTPSLYNSFAWRMSELELNLEIALERINDAIKMTKSYNREKIAQFKDTKAEILWKMERVDEAVKVIDECIKVRPNDDYYKKQREKFLK